MHNLGVTIWSWGHMKLVCMTCNWEHVFTSNEIQDDKYVNIDAISNAVLAHDAEVRENV